MARGRRNEAKAEPDRERQEGRRRASREPGAAGTDPADLWDAEAAPSVPWEGLTGDGAGKEAGAAGRECASIVRESRGRPDATPGTADDLGLGGPTRVLVSFAEAFALYGLGEGPRPDVEKWAETDAGRADLRNPYTLRYCRDAVFLAPSGARNRLQALLGEMERWLGVPR